MRFLLASILAAVLVTGCGSDSGAPPERAATPPTSNPTVEAEPTEEANAEPECRVGNNVITITGGEGVSCKTAKRVFKAHINGKAPKGWDCAVRACTSVKGSVVRDFIWSAR